MIEGWKKLYPQPFTGVTSDGVVRDGLFPLADALPGEEAPTADMVAAAEKLLALASLEQVSRLSYPVDAPEWQSWANPEFMQHDTGLRLDELDPALRDAALAVVEASLSPEGFALVRNLMRINGFLGDLVDLPLLMNEYSYNFALYGVPSETEPWGWQLFGHHVALNCLVAGSQLVVSPVFLGAEPDIIDAGPHQGVKVFKERIQWARELMAELPAELRAGAVVFEHMEDPAMPEGRLHPGDERHLAGCFQDNRVIPYEGIAVSCDAAVGAGACWTGLWRTPSPTFRPGRALPAAGKSRNTMPKPGSLDRRLAGRRTPSTSASRAPWSSWNSTTTPESSSTTTTLRRSTCTPWCGRPTATTTAGHWSSSTQPA